MLTNHPLKRCNHLYLPLSDPSIPTPAYRQLPSPTSRRVALYGRALFQTASKGVSPAMDALVEDADLAKDMVRFLSQELKSVRRQLEEAQQSLSARSTTAPAPDEAVELLQAENAALRGRISVLEQELAAFEDVKPMKSEPPSSVKAEGLDQEELGRAKVKKTREKYKRLKQAHQELTETLATTQTKLEEATDAKNNALQDLEALQKQPVERAPRSDDFLNSTHTSPDGLPAYADMRPCIMSEKFSFPKRAEKLAAHGRPLHYSSRELLFRGDQPIISHGVLVVPTHRYNPQAADGKGTWVNNASLTEGQSRDVVYKPSSGYTWLYLGTYKCVFKEILDIDSMQYLTDSIKSHLHTRTVQSPDLVPPFLARMVTEMYAAGALKVQFFGLERTSFNHEFYSSLLNESKAKSKGTPIDIPSEGTTSRKRLSSDSESGHHIQSKKKRPKT